jgi:hypothetical protein
MHKMQIIAQPIWNLRDLPRNTMGIFFNDGRRQASIWRKNNYIFFLPGG